jgi:hypothetical protein
MTFASACPRRRRVGLLLRGFESQLGHFQVLLRLGHGDVALLLRLLHDRDDLLVRLADRLVLLAVSVCVARSAWLLATWICCSSDWICCLAISRSLIGFLMSSGGTMSRTSACMISMPLLLARLAQLLLRTRSGTSVLYRRLMKSRAVYWLPTRREKLREYGRMTSLP